MRRPRVIVVADRVRLNPSVLRIRRRERVVSRIVIVSIYRLSVFDFVHRLVLPNFWRLAWIHFWRNNWGQIGKVPSSRTRPRNRPYCNERSNEHDRQKFHHTSKLPCFKKTASGLSRRIWVSSVAEKGFNSLVASRVILWKSRLALGLSISSRLLECPDLSKRTH